MFGLPKTALLPKKIHSELFVQLLPETKKIHFMNGVARCQHS